MTTNARRVADLVRDPAIPRPDVIANSRVIGRIAIRTDMFPNGPDPLAYAVGLDGHCNEPEIFEGDTAIVSPSAPLLAGHFVVLWFASDAQPQIKRLIEIPAALPGRVRFLSPESAPSVHVECLNPHQVFRIRLDRLRAIHLVVGVLRPDEHAEAQRIARTGQVAS